MKFLCAALCVLLMPLAAESQTKVPAGVAVGFAWDHTLSNQTASATSRYECQVGANPLVNTGLPVGAATYLWPIPQNLLTVGSHQVQCRAVGVMGPGPWLVSTIEVTAILPGSLTNPRFVPSTVPIALDKAVTYINAAAEILIDRQPSMGEMNFIFQSYLQKYPGETGSTVTKYKTLKHMEDIYAQLVKQ